MIATIPTCMPATVRRVLEARLYCLLRGIWLTGIVASLRRAWRVAMGVWRLIRGVAMHGRS